jgi:hypothetical protein
MSRSPRAEALHIIESGEIVETPELPDFTPGSPEALAYINSYRERHFVILSRVTGQLIGQVLARRSPDNKDIDTNHPPDMRWQALAHHWADDLRAVRPALAETPAYRTAQQFAVVTGTLDPRQKISLDDQLESGAGTAILTTLTMLRNLPQIIRYHAGQDAELDVPAIARHPRSATIIRQLAKTSINQAMAAQTALAGRHQASRWDYLDQVLQPSHFALHEYPDGSKSIGYADFHNLEVPAKYCVRYPLSPVHEPTPIRNIQSHQPKTVGCPVSLLRGTLKEFWQWGVDLVVANDLWEEEWPIVTTEA